VGHRVYSSKGILRIKIQAPTFPLNVTGRIKMVLRTSKLYMLSTRSPSIKAMGRLALQGLMELSITGIRIVRPD
jgi:hypothetical protein